MSSNDPSRRFRDGLNLKPAAASLRGWLDAACAFLYPNTCQICGAEKATQPEGFVGAQCRRKVRLIRQPFCNRCGLPFEGDISTAFECENCREMTLHFRSARSAAVARGVLLDVIHRYKYQRALWFEPFLAGLLIQQAGPVLCREKWDWLVPVPLHPTKLREREFNQAERLAVRLSAATGIPVQARLLRRVLPTRTQTLLSRRERTENVRHAFALRPSARLSGRRIVLLDDVFTTGATTSACAEVLRKAGADEVCVWTVARGL